jgi:N-methylhydantoinase A/oxoprolinase/acetone carboxylase beta subunit
MPLATHGLVNLDSGWFRLGPASAGQAIGGAMYVGGGLLVTVLIILAIIFLAKRV